MTKTETAPKSQRCYAIKDVFVDNVLYVRGSKFVTSQTPIKGYFMPITRREEQQLDSEKAEAKTLTLRRPPGTTKEALARITGGDGEVDEKVDPTMSI